MTSRTRIKTRFSDTCSRCGRSIEAGETVEWVKGQGVTCPNSCKPARVSHEEAQRLGRVVAYLRKRKEAGDADEFVNSVLAQAERKGRLTNGQLIAVEQRMTPTAPPGRTRRE